MIIQYNNGISKIINLLDGTTNQPSKFRARKQIDINDESRRTYDNSGIKLKTSTIWSNLCDCCDAYILVSGTITTIGQEMMIMQKEQAKEIKK